jgi:hypothetical protein
MLEARHKIAREVARIKRYKSDKALAALQGQ